ncbi:uncharacterized protein JCM15063_002319 [Sporobolomyces koalae]|uniref:uncharacterized protein n=1 Tax=Sporobolomyces koalae TaxID=500713 RepID=UPI0031742FCE
MQAYRLSTALPFRIAHRTLTPTSIRSIRVRLASSVAAADLPRAPPHDKIPFSAPPKDETKGDLGQVHLPAMDEKPVQASLQIPLEPDSYRAPSASSSSSEFPTLQPSSAKVITASDPSTYPQPPSHAATSADDTFEAFEGDHKLAASAASTEHSDQTSRDRSTGTSRDETHSDQGHEGQPLSQEDRVGLLKLGGIVVGGYILSGLFRPFKPERSQNKQIEI